MMGRRVKDVSETFIANLNQFHNRRMKPHESRRTIYTLIPQLDCSPVLTLNHSVRPLKGNLQTHSGESGHFLDGVFF